MAPGRCPGAKPHDRSGRKPEGDPIGCGQGDHSLDQTKEARIEPMQAEEKYLVPTSNHREFPEQLLTKIQVAQYCQVTPRSANDLALLKAEGEIASLTGAQDDPRYFQISAEQAAVLVLVY